MTKVVSFRPTEEEHRLIERIRRRHRFQSRTEAVRFLLSQAQQKEGDLGLQPLLSFRVPKKYRWRGERSITSEEIDEAVYGDHVWPGD